MNKKYETNSINTTLRRSLILHPNPRIKVPTERAKNHCQVPNVRREQQKSWMKNKGRWNRSVLGATSNQKHKKSCKVSISYITKSILAMTVSHDAAFDGHYQRTTQSVLYRGRWGQRRRRDALSRWNAKITSFHTRSIYPAAADRNRIFMDIKSIVFSFYGYDP